MRISNFTDYSLRVLIYLGLKGDELATVAEIAEKYHISRNHLTKVVHNLSKLELITSFKGANGGIKLALAPGDINLGKLVRHLESNFHIIECFSAESECQIDGCCRLKEMMAKALRSFFVTLEAWTLADILASNTADLKQALVIK